MTASGLPAALIKLATSAVPAVVSSDVLLETFDTPESIEFVRGGGAIGAEELELPAMAASIGLRVWSNTPLMSSGT